MSSLKIAAYTVAKNEAKSVAAFVAGCAGVDGIFVTDTGSTDDTVRLLRNAGVQVTQATVRPWRFDTARNISLATVPACFDVCIKVDLDEVLAPGWREKLEAAWHSQPNVSRLRYSYTWNWKTDPVTGAQVPDVVLPNNLVHARHGSRYYNATHETLGSYGLEEVCVWSDMEIWQFPDTSKGRPNDMPLLELAVREKRDARTLFYLGREYYFKSRWQECKDTLTAYLAVYDAWWKPERSKGLRLIGEACEHLGLNSEALHNFTLSCLEDPSIRENWLALAQHGYNTKDWELCWYGAKRALAIEQRHTHYVCEGSAWGSKPYDLAAIACWNLGRINEGQGLAQTALELEPTNPRLQENVRFFQEKQGAQLQGSRS